MLTLLHSYSVLHFDLRIAGFADLSSLYFSLSTQLESYFAAIPDLLGKEFGWGEFEKESWAFKHSRAEIVERLKHGGEVKTSDVARLLEQFQSALLSYWNFVRFCFLLPSHELTFFSSQVPKTEAQRKRDEQRKKEDDEDESSTVVSAPSTPASALETSHRANDPTEARMRQGAVPTPQLKPKPVEDLIEARSFKEKDDSTRAKQRKDERLEKRKKEDEADEEPQPPAKRVPVFFLDEAHKVRFRSYAPCFFVPVSSVTTAPSSPSSPHHLAHRSSPSRRFRFFRPFPLFRTHDFAPTAACSYTK